MENRYYLVQVVITSSGAENRTLTPYDNVDTALRKFFETFNVIGAGPNKICAALLDSNLNTIKREYWAAPVEEPINPDEEVEPEA